MAATSSQLRAWWSGYLCDPGDMTNFPFPTSGGWKNLLVAEQAIPVWAAVSQIMSSEPYYFEDPDGGTYNCREIDNSGRWSLHSYGIAIDLNPDENPQKNPLTHNYPGDFIKRMEGIRANGKQAVAWGGRWTSVAPDAMHWQVNVAPVDCKNVVWDKGGGQVPTTGPNGEPNWDEVSDWAKASWTEAHKAGLLTKDSHPRNSLEVEELMVYLNRAGVI